jgi:hypothetical protein
MIGLGEAETKEQQVNKPLRKPKMFVTHERTTTRGKRKKARAAKRAEGQDENSNLLNSKETCARDERKSDMNKTH